MHEPTISRRGSRRALDRSRTTPTKSADDSVRKMGKHKKQGGGAPPVSTPAAPTSAPPSGVARQLLAGVLSAALALGAGQLLSAVTASPSPPNTPSSSAAPPSAAGPIAVGATELDHFDAAHNASLQWGTWRPGEYFGLRSRTAPDALAAGLMWTARGADGGGGGGLRHSCKEGELGHYAYTAHDGRSYAAQEITDAGNGIALRTEFARPPSNDGWAVRIEGRAPAGAKGKPTPQLVFFYVAVDAAHAEECRAGTDAYIRHAAAQLFAIDSAQFFDA